MITELTKEQIEAQVKYVEMGIKIGLATGGDIDEAYIREVTDKHRELCGVPKATNFIIRDSPMAVIKEFPSCTTGNALYGQHDISWLIYYQYMRVELGVTGLEKIQYLLELAKHVGWMWMSSDTTIVTRRPEKISFQRKPGVLDVEIPGCPGRVLHNYDGKAVEYRDGNGVYVINGTFIPPEFHHLVETRAESISVEEVMGIKNTEIRTEFLKKIGIDKAFDKLDKKKLDAKELDKGGLYELFSVQMGETTRVYLRGECPSNQEPFFEAVPPDCQTVEQALNFRNGFKIEIPFTPPLELT